METICENEFEKWWKEREKSIPEAMKNVAAAIWNKSWNTCGKKILESLKGRL